MKRCLLSLSLICSVVSTRCNIQPDLIESFEIINKNKIVVKANRSFSRKFIKEDFFAEYDESINLTKLNKSIVTIPFILSIIPVVWVSNKTYSIEVMDRDLYYSLQEVKKVFRIFYPEQEWAGELIPEQLVTNTIVPSTISDEPALAILFSGGLDSVDTSISYLDAKQLLVTAWGADVKVRASKQWNRVLGQCQNFSQTYGHDHTFIKSNFREFTETQYLYNKFPRWWVRVSHALSLAGLVAPLLIKHKIPALLIASTYTIEHPNPYGSHPAIDNNITFAGSSVYHACADKDRVQKIMNFTNICREKNITLPNLRVCWSSPQGENCLKCEKCLRTLTEIIIAGQVPEEYGFNISVDKAIQKIKKFFQEQKGLKSNEIFFWSTNVAYLRSLAKEIESNPMFFHKYLPIIQDLLGSINLRSCRKSLVRSYSPKKQRLFKDLWKKNLKKISMVRPFPSILI